MRLSANYKSSLCNFIISKTYEKYDYYYNSVISDFVFKNNSVSSTYESGFKYNNTKYSTTTIDPIFKLHSSLREDFKKFITNQEDIIKEKEIIRSFLARTLNECHSPSQIIQLIPEELQHTFGKHMYTDSVLYKDIIPFDEERIAAFRLENHQYIEIIRQRLVYNLLF